jgi:hypothetical protein
MDLLNQAAYAKRHGVSRKAVTTWKQRGWLVFDGDLIEVEPSDLLLRKYRRGGDAAVTQSVTRAKGNKSGNKQGNKSKPPIEAAPGETNSEAADRLSDHLDWSIDEAKRVKETYLALLNQLEYDQKSGAVVLVSDVAKAVGNEYAQVRTKLLGIPSAHAAQLHRCKTVVELHDALERVITYAMESLTSDQTE